MRIQTKEIIVNKFIIVVNIVIHLKFHWGH